MRGAALAFFSVAVGFAQVKTPDDPMEHYHKGELFFDQRNFQGAANEFRKALSSHLESYWEGWAHLYLGSIFEMTNQHDRALTEFQFANDSSAGIFRVTDFLPAPIPEHKVDPEYSEEARLAGLEGTVTVSFSLSDEGAPRDVRIEKTLGLGLDVKALEAVEQWRYAPGTAQWHPSRVTAEVDFRLPDKQSRWHLLKAEFHTGEGISRPVFTSAKYPFGAGISARAIDEGQLVGVMGRMGTATVALDIDEHGTPEHFQVLDSSYDVWGPEAIAVIREWHFEPGRKGGLPVSVPATFDLAWGARKLAIAEARTTGVSRPNPAAPQPLTQCEPSYTQEARDAHLQGSVLVAAIVGADGMLYEARVLKPLGMGLDYEALVALSKWRFVPGKISGANASVPALFELDFKLPEKPRAQRQ